MTTDQVAEEIVARLLRGTDLSRCNIDLRLLSGDRWVVWLLSRAKESCRSISMPVPVTATFHDGEQYAFQVDA